MFDVNLINPPGIQIQGDNHVISYRDNTPKRDLLNPSEQISALIKRTSSKWKWIRYSVFFFAIATLGIIIYTSLGDTVKSGSSERAPLSEVQFFTILNSMYELRTNNVYLEIAEYTTISSSIAFVSESQDMLNILAHRIESEFHHTGWISGDLVTGGRLLYQWVPALISKPIQTVYVSKNIILDIVKDMGLECLIENNAISVVVPMELIEDILERIDSLNHTLSISFRIAPVEEIDAVHQYKLVFEYLTDK